MKIMKTIYRCLNAECERTFTAEQGSRRRYCPECMAKRIINGGKKAKKVVANEKQGS